ncbi:delta-aminolevulinic acid dehydratase [Microbulbifer yueqingensis]|uniref:Delta-aminolevulinic acid dehydratase n=1 Tax=Microbulbifer yueqingensis TaxID=658219 RepID=A0A1G8VL65_9GAMM|nr:delta-aminolevulinic acid dehydratase [Microbulbifer yueqingensis]SDJ66752.1 hypothetical protein SAMN05216212_0621 [Microbulbifer yueqingensis]
MSTANSDLIETSFGKLRNYVEREGYRGNDPFDGLSGRFNNTVFFRYRFFRLLVQQLIKRSPIDFRRVLGIDKKYIPKGLGLLLAGYARIYSISRSNADLDCCNRLFELILSQKTDGYSGNCWGFPGYWQTKAFFQPFGAPQVVASTYIGNGLLDFYELAGNKAALREASDIAPFILNDLNQVEYPDGSISVSYTVYDNSAVYNATALAARFLSRLYRYTNDPKLLEFSERAIRYVCGGQKSDGSWPYSPLSFHQWVDGFHSGYNIECIHDYQKYTGDRGFAAVVDKGLSYYIDNFFTNAGVPKYYNNSTYPIDVHSPAQLVITLSKLGRFQEHRAIIDRVLGWTIENMQSDDGFFYYQINSFFTSKIPYMRWSQAWMFYAMATYLMEVKSEKNN